MFHNTSLLFRIFKFNSLQRQVPYCEYLCVKKYYYSCLAFSNFWERVLFLTTRQNLQERSTKQYRHISLHILCGKFFVGQSWKKSLNNVLVPTLQHKNVFFFLATVSYCSFSKVIYWFVCKCLCRIYYWGWKYLRVCGGGNSSNQKSS